MDRNDRVVIKTLNCRIHKRFNIAFVQNLDIFRMRKYYIINQHLFFKHYLLTFQNIWEEVRA